jgi:pimeloyl-ACP methyl ester carboxylesterase
MTFSADSFGMLDVPGGTLYWESTGRGPALVLVHAGIADHRMWDDDVPSFAGGHRVVTYDCRGFGRSRTDAVDYSNRADLAALLDQLVIERAALLGCSRGGQIALDFALERPERVSALVLVACGPGGMEHEPTAVERPLFESEEPLVAAGDWAGVADLDVRLWVDGVGQPPTRVPAAIRERVRAMSLANYTAGYPESRPIPLQPPAIDRLAEVRAPTLIIHGALDVSAVTAGAEALELGIPGARRVLLPRVAHMVNLEQPDDFRRLVRDFLFAAGA